MKVRILRRCKCAIINALDCFKEIEKKYIFILYIFLPLTWLVMPSTQNNPVHEHIMPGYTLAPKLAKENKKSYI